MKVHQTVLERAYEAITVVSAYRQSPPSIFFSGEKRDQPFHRQRPTARLAHNNFYNEFFPGYDHVEHYAEIVATYLGIRQRNGDILTIPSSVYFKPASCSDTLNALEATNIREFPEGVDPRPRCRVGERA